MSQVITQGFFTAGGGGTTHTDALLASVPAGDCLTSVNFEGVFSLETPAFATPAASSIAAFNQMTGLQWTTHGGTPVSLDTTTPSGGNWLLRADGLLLTEIYQPVVESTDYTYVLVVPFALHWRGLFYPSAEIDIYFSTGQDATRSDVGPGKAFGDYSVTYATFP